MAISWHYNRPELAKEITGQLTSGLFNRIAYFGQRRIGKTMFLLKDLAPALLNAECLPVYISMWCNKNAPQKEIINKLQLALKQLDTSSPIKKFLQIEVSKKRALGTSAEFGKIDPVAASDDDLVIIGKLLRELVEKAGAIRVILLVDEVQYLITAKEFTSLQYSLRTVFDELNENISVLYTGSSRHGIEAMFNNKDFPFYNSASQVAFPHLGADYVEHINSLVTEHFQLDYSTEELLDFFKSINHSAFWFDRLVKHLVLTQTSLSKAVTEIRTQMVIEGQISYTTRGLH